MKKFMTAAYIRLSREDGDKEESDSVGNQRKLLTEYITVEENMVLYDVYIDDGYTGTDFNRPAFRRMIGDIEAGKVNCVAVKDLSRFGRDYIDTGRYLERYFPEKGVRFISVMERIDSRKQAYDLLLPIRNIFNEQYARDISEKVQTAVRTKQRAGEFVGAFACYGYRKSPADKNRLIVDPYAAAVVRRIFSLYIGGCGKQQIAKLLNAEEILSPSEYKKAMGLSYHNPNRPEGKSYWSYAAVNNILHREMYVGNMVQGTKHQCLRGRQKQIRREDWIIVEHTHEPVIDRETWDKAQFLLRRRRRETGTETDRNLFAGLVKCGDCGRSMVKNMWRLTDGSRVRAMYCGTYKRHGRQYCTSHALPLAILEKIVLDDLNELIRSAGNLRRIADQCCSPGTVPGREAEEVQAEMERVRRLKQSVYEDYREGLISREEFLSYHEAYEKKETLCRQQVKMMEQRKRDCGRGASEIPWLNRLLNQGRVETLDRNIVTEMVHEVRVYENRKITIIYNLCPFIF